MKSTILLLLVLFTFQSSFSQRKYVNRIDKFEITLPKQWTTSRFHKDLKLLAFDFNVPKSDMARLYLSVIKSPRVNMDSVVVDFEANNKRFHYPTFKVTESSLVTINGKTFYRILANHSIPEGLYKSVVYLIYYDDRLYMLDFAAIDSKFDSYLSIFDQTAQSFIIRK